MTSSASHLIDCRNLTYKAASKTTVKILSTLSLTEALQGDSVDVRDPIGPPTGGVPLSSVVLAIQT